MRANKSFFALLLTVLIPTLSNAQIVYSNRYLSINQKDASNLGLVINEWPTLKWTCKGTNFLRIDVSPANPRIAGTGDNIVFFNTETSTFNSIEVANVYNYSDARAKENVNALSSGLKTLMQLRPVSYNWKKPGFTTPVAKKSMVEGDSIMTAYGPTDESDLQFGFLAQDVEEVLPDIVKCSESGSKMVNYIAMIPILVKSIQELQSIVKSQAETIEQMSKSRQWTSASNGSTRIISCSPNPAIRYVTIETCLADEIDSAEVIITSMTGDIKQQYVVSTADSTISADISSLMSGIYIVSLHVNNIVVDFCRLVKE